MPLVEPTPWSTNCPPSDVPPFGPLNCTSLLRKNPDSSVPTIYLPGGSTSSLPNMVLPVKQSNPCTSTAETLPPRKLKGEAQESCLLPLNHFWYMSHIYKEGIKQIERKNKIKMVAQVHVTFEAEQEDGNPHEALNEFIDLSQSCSADSGEAVIPLKFVDPDHWSDALKVIKRNKDKLLLTMSSEEVIVSGPKQSQDEFSAVLNAMQKTNTPAEEHKPTSDGTSLKINLTTSQLTKSPTVEDNKQLENSEGKQEGTTNQQTKSPTVENNSEPVITSVEDANVKAKSDLNVESSNSKNKQSLQTCRAKPSLRNLLLKKKPIARRLRLTRPSDTTGLGGLPKKSSCENERKEDSSQPSLIPPTAQQKAEASTKTGASGDSKDDLCPICLDRLIKKKQLKCKHTFCDECLQASVQHTGPMCPVCKDVFGVMEGDQPDGVMTWSCSSSFLPGFSGCGSIMITYTFPNGKQTKKHPNPGQPYQGTTRTAYLPDNEEGQEVLKLLKKAFDQKMTFTVGTSRTSGLDNQVIWNDISHKTSKTGGPQSFGYPDPSYLSKVKGDLKAKGIE
ncbi:E3 ubiquitin-protein ligase DTX3L-like isoform X2 [Xiphophorus hellerii]|uniref:E3 ubiquitin-protein ligase DTX3L-like isoform X2 n=1 Tax=Xiphophorus hellerii TaxID=8084 RepID=UPI0013B3CE47|nr:E3 ubiquitin-protein ligase DTX3L-like isoform X2 [Xiphophorus hellerii]